MKTSFIQFLLIFECSFLVIFPQTSVQGAKNGLILWSATITPTLLPFFTAHWFYAILPNVPSDLPALLPPQNFFLGINEGLFFYTCILGFFVDVPSVRRSLMIFISCGSFTKSGRRKAIIYLQSDQSHVLCWIYSYIDPSWQNFCSALFFLPVFSLSCVI